MAALSLTQRYALEAMYCSNGIGYDGQRDRTMIALQQRGLARFQRHHKYGRDCWHLTEAGTAEAAKRAAQRVRRFTRAVARGAPEWITRSR